MMPLRMRGALRYFLPSIGKVVRWTFASREIANYTYDLTETSVSYLAHTVSVITGADPLVAKRYLSEIQRDDSLKRHVRDLTTSSTMRHSSDSTCHFWPKDWLVRFRSHP